MKRGYKRNQRFRKNWAAAWILCAAMIAGLSLMIASGTAEGGTETLPEAQEQAEIPKPLLLDEAPEDVLCIGVLPTESGGVMKYYVPEEAVRQALYEKISGMDVVKLDSLDIPPQWVLDAWDYNITVKYGNYSLYLKEGGVMRIDHWQDYSLTEWVVKDASAADYILGIVKNEIGISPFDASSIRNIVSAEITAGPLYAGQPMDSITLTDPEKLRTLENMLSGAEKSFWSKCPFGQCALVLTTEGGHEIRLAMACDSCTVFYADGCFYDYMPPEYRDSDGDHPHNNLFFDLFGVTAEAFCGGDA